MIVGNFGQYLNNLHHWLKGTWSSVLTADHSFPLESTSYSRQISQFAYGDIQFLKFVEPG